MLMHPIEKILQYSFTNKNIFREAITHPSASHTNYQRLEFLGDRVLGLIIAEWLMRHHTLSEGIMAQWLARLTSKEHLAHVGENIKLYPNIISHLSSEHKRLGYENILADVLEALIGAVFLDSNYHTTYTTFIPHLILEDDWFPPEKNAKNMLQEWAQKHHIPLPQYIITQHTTQGFTIECHLSGYDVTRATALQKKNAEFHAAQRMLALISKEQ